MHILLLLGAATLAGLTAGKLLEKVGVPQVVGYILAGVCLGDSAAGLLSNHLLDLVEPLSQVALGFIGFMVGGELKAEVFRKYGSKFITILLCEGLLTALLVGTAVYLWTSQASLGLLLGALASPTAPAATVNVLWEYRSKGPLTTTILAIVALDDGLGLLLYAFAVAMAEVLLGAAPAVGSVWLQPFQEILGSVGLGLTAGYLTYLAARRFRREQGQTLSLLFGVILTVCGCAELLGLSQILANLTTGLTLANLLPARNTDAFESVKAFTPPLYTLFFVFIGAQLDLSLLPKMSGVGLVYLTGRTLGKMTGSSLGGWISDAPDVVRKYLGWALFSQAGVAIGLALDIAHRFARFGPDARQAGHTVLNVIAATTVVVQIIGPTAVKYAIRQAGEIPEEARDA